MKINNDEPNESEQSRIMAEELELEAQGQQVADEMTQQLVQAVQKCLQKHAPEVMALDDRITDVSIGWKNGHLHFLVGVDSMRTWHEIKGEIGESYESLPVDYYVERPSVFAFAAAARESDSSYTDAHIRDSIAHPPHSKRRACVPFVSKILQYVR